MATDRMETKEESLSSESQESESISLRKDEHIYDEELRITLGKLTRNLMFRPMWRSRFTAFFVISGYILTYSTGARLAHHFDQYGILFCIPLSLCMFFIGIPLVYLEMSLGQFTSLNAIVIYNRMVPLFAGVGVSMTLLSIIVTITDHLALYNFVAIVGNTIQINLNEMPWHRCHNFFDSEGLNTVITLYRNHLRKLILPLMAISDGRSEMVTYLHQHFFTTDSAERAGDCKSRTTCKEDYQLDFYKLDKSLRYQRGSHGFEPREFAGECIASASHKIFHKNHDTTVQKAHYDIFKRTGSEISYL